MKIVQHVLILAILLSFMQAGCSRSDDSQKVRVPQYPGSVEDQTHHAEIMGMKLGMVKRVITDDSYDKVLAYYKKELAHYGPIIVSHTLEDGRQTAITIKDDETGTKTLAIQEFKGDGKVAIVLMRMGF
jgi:hypothetical protein